MAARGDGDRAEDVVGENDRRSPSVHVRSPPWLPGIRQHHQAVPVHRDLDFAGMRPVLHHLRLSRPALPVAWSLEERLVSRDTAGRHPPEHLFPGQ